MPATIVGRNCWGHKSLFSRGDRTGPSGRHTALYWGCHSVLVIYIRRCLSSCNGLWNSRLIFVFGIFIWISFVKPDFYVLQGVNVTFGFIYVTTDKSWNVWISPLDDDSLVTMVFGAFSFSFTTVEQFNMPSHNKDINPNGGICILTQYYTRQIITGLFIKGERTVKGSIIDLLCSHDKALFLKMSFYDVKWQV